MRQRRIRNREGQIEECAEWLVRDPRALKGSWSSVFKNEAPVNVELGSGRGQFITRMAKRDPASNFVAVEGDPDIAVRLLQKAKEADLSNLKVVIEYVNDLTELFAEGEVASYYLNFSDPWPRRRDEKKRLTYRSRLMSYAKTAREGAYLAFRTDNEALFDFSLKEMAAAGIEAIFVSRDLHAEECFADMETSEYEDAFAAAGKPICCALARLR